MQRFLILSLLAAQLSCGGDEEPEQIECREGCEQVASAICDHARSLEECDVPQSCEAGLSELFGCDDLNGQDDIAVLDGCLEAVGSMACDAEYTPAACDSFCE